MNKLDLDYYINKLDLQKFISDFKNLNLETLYKKYDLPSKSCLRKILRQLNLSKTREEIAQTRKNTLISIWGSMETYCSYHNKVASECYKNKSQEQLNISEQKRANTCLQKYGVQSPAQNKQVQQTRKTNIIKNYGSYSKYYEDIQTKCKQTNLKRYGYDNVAKSLYIKEKLKNTFLSKYGVTAPSLLPQTKSLSCNTKPNKQFEQLLKENNLLFEKEFKIQNRRYDFKVGNTLIEINPTFTHNCTQNIWGKLMVTEDYHYNKTLLANSQGYTCVHIWDWDDNNAIIDQLKYNQTIVSQPYNIVFKRCIHKDLLYLSKGTNFNNICYEECCVAQSDSQILQVITFRQLYDNCIEILNYYPIINSFILCVTKDLITYIVNKYNIKNIFCLCDISKNQNLFFEMLQFKKYDNIKNQIFWCKNNLNFSSELVCESLLPDAKVEENFYLNHGYCKVIGCGYQLYNLTL